MFDEIVALWRSVTACDYVCPGLVLLQFPQESLKLIFAAVQLVTVEDESPSPPWLRCQCAVVEQHRVVEDGPLCPLPTRGQFTVVE